MRILILSTSSVSVAEDLTVIDIIKSNSFLHKTKRTITNKQNRCIYM